MIFLSSTNFVIGNMLSIQTTTTQTTTRSGVIYSFSWIWLFVVPLLVAFFLFLLLWFFILGKRRRKDEEEENGEAILQGPQRRGSPSTEDSDASRPLGIYAGGEW